MRPLQLKRRLALAGTAGVTVMVAALALGAGVASATPADPPGGNTPTYPSFDNGVVNAIRGSGSDTTFFMMQKISDLYTGAGLYGCTLNSAAGQALYNSGDTSTGSNEEYYCRSSDNISTTDTADNWSRTEVSEGVDDVGSTAGQSQLCGNTVLDSPLAVDFARSSKPAGTYCGDLQETGYAKDSVPAFTYPVSPATFGTVPSGSPYASVNGGSIGPVSSGWLPGDAVGGPYTGTKLSNISNIDNTGGVTSTAYKLWCASDSTRITDWGQLINLGPNLDVPNVALTNNSTSATLSYALPTTLTGSYGVTDVSNSGDIASGTTATISGNTLTLSQGATGSGTDILKLAIGTTLGTGLGAPIGLPVRLIGVNASSGTESTWQSFADSGVASGQSGNGCSANANGNAASDPNSSTATGDNAGAHVALENNASQIGDFAAADWPGDYPDQAVEVATSIYYESNGIYGTNPYSGAVQVNGSQYSGNKLTLNGKSNTTPAVLNNLYPTARTLFNIYRTGSVRASTAGFLNWMCDSQSAITKGKDNSTGVNFDNELTSIIGSYGFIRLNDASSVATGGNTPADNVSGGGVDTSCASALNAGGTAGNGSPAVTTVASPQT